jgi:hypothetical protein
MAEQGPSSLLNLFRQWRNGDASAGNEMAQRFSDWYFTLAVSRLGDVAAREPLQRACERFAQEIPNVTNPNQIVSWAYKVVREELDQAGGRLDAGDIPNGFSRSLSPRALVREAAEAMPPAEIRLLGLAFDLSYPMNRLIRDCEEAGGFPVAILKARQALKRWLKEHREIPFSDTDEVPNLDWAPLPLYEAARLGSAAEEARFERWMLTQYALCRDVAQFATFALALRGGAIQVRPLPESQASRPPVEKSPERLATPTSMVMPPPPKGVLGNRLLVTGLGILVALLVVALVVVLAGGGC